MNETKPIRDVLIVGGGTAGWLTAAFLAKTQAGLRIRVVESTEIGIIGVGEGTFPSIRGTLAAIGISEARFLRECHATFKQGITFVDWLHAPTGRAPSKDTHYFHPFNTPSQRGNGPELLPYWLLGAAGDAPAFAEAATMQKRVADASRAPKRASDGEFLGPMNYAYHFDAARFAALLSTHAKSLGVEHELATVERVERDAQGAIAGLVTPERGTLSADLYVDCTGFRALLIGQALDSPFRELKDTLFVDRAVAMQVPYERADAPIPSYTLSTAHEAGWTWDIGLQQRRGIGYVYSSRHSDDTRAEEVLRDYIGPASQDMSARLLKLRLGYREQHWIKNCVAVGLSGGFLEPLEASGIGLIEAAVYQLSYLFPRDGHTAAAARRFNEHMRVRYERIVDFVKLHYCLTKRRDNPFWIDNTDPASIPETLRELLAMWRQRPPHRLDFVVDLEMYPPSSWQYVLYGMQYPCDLAANRASYVRWAEAQQEFGMIQQISQHALTDLPDHRTLVELMCARA